MGSTGTCCAPKCGEPLPAARPALEALSTVIVVRVQRGRELRITLPAVPEVLPEQVLTDPASWQRYAGTYRDTWGALGRFRIYVQEDKLRMALLGGQPEAIPTTLNGRFDTDAHNVTRFVTRIGVAEREPLDIAAP
jgi:hypothetical protein